MISFKISAIEELKRLKEEAVRNDVIIGSQFDYVVDLSYGLNSDGFIASGTESIVYKGLKKSKDGNISLSCVLKFKKKALRVIGRDGVRTTLNVIERFRNSDLKIFNDLQSCRSVVRIYDVIEDLGEFHMLGPDHESIIDRNHFFCVVEEYIDGWSLEEYCRDEYWKLTETVDLENHIKGKIGFHDFPETRKKQILDSYHKDYDETIRYQDQIFRFMINLCEIMEYVTGQKRILHLDIKPDNIMVTRHGKELVLIDFGRSDYIPSGYDYVESNLAGADYNSDEVVGSSMYQYGTLGYAAPECYAPAVNGSLYPFDDSGFEKGRMSIESDIFSFGATFWECLNMFELYTGCREFALDKTEGGSYYFYKEHLLNDDSYFDRDLSLTSSHYHEKLEQIIRKCTKKRKKGYESRDNKEYYHSYEELKNDIILAKESAPTIVKSENLKVRNTFYIVGGALGLCAAILVTMAGLFIAGNAIASNKLNAIMANYNATRIDYLESAALEKMDSSNESGKEEIYDNVHDFILDQKEGQEAALDEAECIVLVDLLNEISSESFKSEAAGDIVLELEQTGFSKGVKYLVTTLPDDLDSDGYRLAVAYYNVSKEQELSSAYEVLQDFYQQQQDGTDYSEEFYVVLRRLIQAMNHDGIREGIANEMTLSGENGQTATECEHEVKTFLDSLEEEWKNE